MSRRGRTRLHLSRREHLHYTVELDFKEAFTGWERTITNIKKKLIIIENEGTMQHGPKSVSSNFGMPQGRTPILW